MFFMKTFYNTFIINFFYNFFTIESFSKYYLKKIEFIKGTLRITNFNSFGFISVSVSIDIFFIIKNFNRNYIIISLIYMEC